MRKKKSKITSAVYARSFLTTMGLFFLAIPLYGLITEGFNFFSELSELSLLSIFMIIGLSLLGIISTLIGLFASTKKVEKWFGSVTTSEGSILIMVLAYPVYLILSLFYKK